MTKQYQLEDLFKLLMVISQRLESYLQEFDEGTEDDEGEWFKFIDQRQILIDQITIRIKRGEMLPPIVQEQYALPLQQLDEKIKALLERHKKSLQLMIQKLEQGKKQNKTYNNPYFSESHFGYFFDKKK